MSKIRRCLCVAVLECNEVSVYDFKAPRRSVAGVVLQATGALVNWLFSSGSHRS